MREIADRICTTLCANGFQAWYAGGCVRDILLNRSPEDYDIVTDALPEQIQNLFEHSARIGKKHRTITVIIDKIPFEVSTLKKNPDKYFSSPLHEDCSQRSFTVNAMLMAPFTGELFDFYEGRSDLEQGIIKSVEESGAMIMKDPVRLLRAIRFAADLDFRIERSLLDCLKDKSKLIQTIAQERIKNELVRIFALSGDKLTTALKLMFECGLFGSVMIELEDMVPDFSRARVLESLERVSQLSKDPWLRIATLMVTSFDIQETELREKAVVSMSKRLKFPRKQILRLMVISKHYSNFNASNMLRNEIADLIIDCGVFLEDLLHIACSDTFSALSQKLAYTIMEISRNCPGNGNSIISGHRIMKICGCKGRIIGKLKQELLKEQLCGNVCTEEQAEAFLRQKDLEVVS